tara:strand:+ start:1058 stop:1597 length:540 start_codon:yes stop_codon:yes gene_type:complete
MRYMYENFLHAEDFDNLVNHVKNKDFAWFVRLGAAQSADETDKQPAFSHVMWDTQYGPTSPSFSYAVPILKRLDVQGVFRIKVNLDLIHGDKALQPESFHVDSDLGVDGIWAMVLYLNDCNGATVFEEDMAPVRSKANRAIIFPAHMSHSGCHQTDTPFRYVVNTLFAAKTLPTGGQEF